MPPPVPGPDGSPLPADTLVFRIGKDAKLSPLGERKKKASPEMFEPSTDDKNSVGKRVSVWVEELTIADQGWSIMGSNPKNTVVACLNSADIAAIPALDTFQPLAVQWEKAVVDNADGTTSPNTHPGAEGHAGIWGLLQGGGGRPDKDRRKRLRVALADLAEISPVPVPHDIPESEIAYAAYFIAARLGGCACGPDIHWVMAIRQLRRERVRAARESGS